MPGGNGEMASGYVKALAAGSNNEEAAYLFMQWVTAPPLSLVRTMLPYTLRDPYRLSTYKSRAISGALAGGQGLSDQPLRMRQFRRRRHDHAGLAGLRAVHRPHVHGGLGRAGSQERSCSKAAAEWDTTTQRLGVAAQKAAYQEFLKIPGCYADHTIEKVGQAVHIT